MRHRLVHVGMLGAVVASLVGLVAPPAMAAAPAAQLPEISVIPYRDLVDGEAVTVYGRAFTPGAQIGIAECRLGATDPDGCDLSTVHLTNADANGRWKVVVVVKSVIFLSGTGEKVVCARKAGRCIIGAANTADFTEAAGFGLSFVAE